MRVCESAIINPYLYLFIFIYLANEKVGSARQTIHLTQTTDSVAEQPWNTEMASFKELGFLKDTMSPLTPIFLKQGKHGFLWIYNRLQKVVNYG